VKGDSLEKAYLNLFLHMPKPSSLLPSIGRLSLNIRAMSGTQFDG